MKPEATALGDPQDGRWKITLMIDGRRFCIPKFRSSTLQQTTRQWLHWWFPTTSCFGVTSHGRLALLWLVRQDRATINLRSPPSCDVTFWQWSVASLSEMVWLASKVSRYLSILCPWLWHWHAGLCAWPISSWLSGSTCSVDALWTFPLEYRCSVLEFSSRFVCCKQGFIVPTVCLIVMLFFRPIVQSADVKTLDAFHQKCLRQLLGIWRYDRVRNDEVLQWTGLTSLSHLLSRRRISVFGHVARLDDVTPANMALQLHVNVSLNRPPDRTWRRPPGRPRNNWLDQLRNDSTRPTGDL